MSTQLGGVHIDSPLGGDASHIGVALGQFGLPRLERQQLLKVPRPLSLLEELRMCFVELSLGVRDGALQPCNASTKFDLHLLVLRFCRCSVRELRLSMNSTKWSAKDAIPRRLATANKPRTNTTDLASPSMGTQMAVAADARIGTPTVQRVATVLSRCSRPQLFSVGLFCMLAEGTKRQASKEPFSPAVSGANDAPVFSHERQGTREHVFRLLAVLVNKSYKREFRQLRFAESVNRPSAHSTEVSARR